MAKPSLSPSPLPKLKIWSIPGFFGHCTALALHSLLVLFLFSLCLPFYSFFRLMRALLACEKAAKMDEKASNVAVLEKPTGLGVQIGLNPLNRSKPRKSGKSPKSVKTLKSVKSLLTQNAIFFLLQFCFPHHRLLETVAEADTVTFSQKPSRR